MGRMVDPPFEPRNVVVTALLTVDQIDLILKGLQTLPISEAGEFFFGLKQHTEQAIATKRAEHESLHTIPDEAPTPAAPAAKEA